jgi:DNA-binding phage protein
MTPAPNLQQLIDAVREDAAGDDAITQLAQAAQIVAQLEETNDALLSHFVDRCRRGGSSWSEISGALGVSKQAVHKRFAPSGPPPFERFTPRAREVVARAGEEARSRGEGGVGAEHLALALFGDPKSLAAKVLAGAGVERPAVEARLDPAAPEQRTAGGGFQPFRPDAVEVLRATVEEALLLGHNYVGTEHLLLALLRDPECGLGLAYEDGKARVVSTLADL